jgi:signal transduction histidine kinase/CheY-like chemotaxis protein
MIEHQLFFVCVPIFLWFFYHIYPQQVGRKLPWSCTLACTIPIFLTLVFPLHVYAQALFPYQIFVSLIAFIISIHLIKLVIRKQKDAIYFSLSFLILFIFTLHDVLLSHFVINGRPIVQFGVIAFIISQSFILQRRYVNSLSLVQTMAEELKLRNNELIKVDQVKDEFLAYTSHELRTPIHGIVGLTSTLLKDNRNPLSHGQNHQLKLIESSARRLGNLVNDILDFSKLKHQELSIRLIRVDLSAVLGVTLKILDPLIDRSKINFKLDIPAQLPAVQADENRLQQILFNLIGNAIKFTAQGEIRVTVKYHKNHVHISISDNGPGIAKNQRDLLFEPFKQLHNNIEGTGLGLSITKKLVELHNSELSILSKEGEGTNVQFSLAIASEELINQAADIQLIQSEQDKNIPFSQQKMQQQTLNMDSLPANQKTTILVVDDEEVNRQVISSQLSLEGYHVLVSHSGEEALLILEKTKPHLILLDLMMPHMNGFEVCSAIREQYNRFELPVLMLTASHQINDVVKAINIGANDYLYKPYHDIEMLARVHNLISASESQKK